MPKESTKRTALLAVRAGYVLLDGVTINGIDNGFMRFFWRQYVCMSKKEHKRMLLFLKKIKELTNGDNW